MARALVFAAVVGLMPEACAKLLGPPADKPRVIEPPPVLPSATVTAPPTYQAPDLGPPPTSAPPPGTPSPELARAREASKRKDNKGVKAALEKRVRSGKSNLEEATLLLEACGNLKDKACVDLVRKAHPELEGM